MNMPHVLYLFLARVLQRNTDRKIPARAYVCVHLCACMHIHIAYIHTSMHTHARSTHARTHARTHIHTL